MSDSPAPTYEDLFAYGARWLRADFHLHTPSDRHFRYDRTQAEGTSNWQDEWINRLSEERIHIGVITNHNKFNLEEFRQLRKRAAKRAIGLFPGVELSVRGGQSPVHILIVFDPETWIDNREQNDFVNRFLGSAFEQVANYESEDRPCRWSLSETIEKLDEYGKNGRDSFVVLAHVDDKCGAFKELGSGLRHEFSSRFSRYVLAAQKVRSDDNWKKLKQWLGSDWKPARVEGSDCKSLDEVGVAHTQNERPQVSSVKLGEMSFSALRLALNMKEQRVAADPAPHAGGRLESASFVGGLLDSVTVRFNPEMTNVIGPRGSGKSSLLETIRYALNVEVKHLDGEDVEYKESLVERLLGSGGSVTIDFLSRDGKRYTVSRVLRDAPVVHRDGQVIPDIRPDSLLNVRYFGQKDLARFSEKQFAHELIERFVGGLSDTSENDELLHRIQSLLMSIDHYDNALSQLEETRAARAAVREQLRAFDDYNLQEKLREQLDFETDRHSAEDLIAAEEDTVQALGRWFEEHYEPYKRTFEHVSESEGNRLHSVIKEGRAFLAALETIQETLNTLQARYEATKGEKDKLDQNYFQLRDRFAEMRRELKLPEALSPDTYLDLTKQDKTLTAKLSELESIEKKRTSARRQLEQALSELQKRWHKQFRKKKAAVDVLNAASEGVQIIPSFKDDKGAFIDHVSALTTGLQKRTVEKIAAAFPDGTELYRDLVNGAPRLAAEAELSREQVEKLNGALKHNAVSLATFRPPDRVELTYHGKPLHQQSIGQRATALMLFLLSQDDIDVLVVDQPEDDLDNQTVYAEIIKRITDRKGRRQIIFATHNPNIPVLGDAEQIAGCRFFPDRIEVSQGAVDTASIQREIVEVMEGGREAFERRQEIYQAWMP